jgi:hypothetical protein
MDGVRRVIQSGLGAAGGVSGNAPVRDSKSTEQSNEIPQRGDEFSSSESSSVDSTYDSLLQANANDRDIKAKSEKMEAKLILSNTLTDTIKHRTEGGERLNAEELRQMRLEANQLESEILESEDPKLEAKLVANERLNERIKQQGAEKSRQAQLEMENRWRTSSIPGGHSASHIDESGQEWRFSGGSV